MSWTAPSLESKSPSILRSQVCTSLKASSGVYSLYVLIPFPQKPIVDKIISFISLSMKKWNQMSHD